VVSKDDVVKYMLWLQILKGRIEKWILALSEFDLTYQSAKAIKGQVMADLVTQHCGLEVAVIEPIPWYYHTIDGVLLKCLGEEEAKVLMGEIHEGVCGAHQSPFKMKWMIRNNSYY
jgi:hypothetical protein